MGIAVPVPESLDALFRCDLDALDLDAAEGDLFAVNRELRLPPWSPPAVRVWKERACPTAPGSRPAAEWMRVHNALVHEFARWRERQHMTGLAEILAAEAAEYR